MITSDYGSMSEVGVGGGAVLVDPRSVSAIADAMARLLSDKNYLETLAKEAAMRSWGSWAEYADAVWKFLSAGPLDDD